MRLERRIAALESGLPSDLAHLSDADIEQRMRDIHAQLSAAGCPFPADWWEAYERRDFRTADRLLEELRCAVLAED